jgi:ppGpp synthetase/RelA/SpoT-type nucleotidyltranferase
MLHLRQELSAKLRSAGLVGLTAARLKRMGSIRAKLRRGPHTLYQMQDIGGCRAIVGSVDEIRDIERVYQRSARHEFRNRSDYLEQPKADGYRSLHLVYRFKASPSLTHLTSSPMLVELQLRTKLQHAWATAVETVGAVLGEDLKGGRGDVTPSFPPAGIRAGRLFCASARLKQWAA